MPSNIVKTKKDEARWQRAKRLAAQSGQAFNYAYIMSIYKKLMRKSYMHVIPISRARDPGRDPVRAENARLRRLTQMPTRRDMGTSHPVLSLGRVADDLGLTQADQKKWIRMLQECVGSTDWPPHIALTRVMRDHDLDPVLRKIMMQKFLSFLNMEKAQARGGKYHRRVALPGGGYRYYYDEAKYRDSKDAHVSGRRATVSYAVDRVISTIKSAGKKGCGVGSLKKHVGRFGVKRVAAVLKHAVKNNQIIYKNKKLYWRD